jgi:hypothetical protein
MHFSIFIISVTVVATAVSERHLHSSPFPEGVIYARQFSTQAPTRIQQSSVVLGTTTAGTAGVAGQSSTQVQLYTWADLERITGQTCDRVVLGVPLCKAPGMTTGSDLLVSGTAIATPYKNSDSLLASAESAFSSALSIMATMTEPLAGATNVPLPAQT